jgi:hypothetical protein
MHPGHLATIIGTSLTSVNLNYPRSVRSECSTWPAVVYYSCMHVAVAIFGQVGSSWRTFRQLLLMWPRRHSHDPGQATRTFLSMQTRTYTPTCFCWHLSWNSGPRWWLLSDRLVNVICLLHLESHVRFFLNDKHSATTSWQSDNRSDYPITKP